MVDCNTLVYFSKNVLSKHSDSYNDYTKIIAKQQKDFFYLHYKQNLYCNKVRRKEGSGQGWLVKTQVCLFKTDKLTQVRTLRHPETSTLSFVSAITLCIRSDCFSLTARALESSLRLSLNWPFHGGFYPGLHANYYNQTQVILILHLTHLLTAVLLSLSPAADFAETTPPSPHTPTALPQAGKPSGLQPPPPPPHSWRGSRLQSSASPACGSPWIWRAVMPDTNGWSARWYPSCGGATARGAWSEQRVNSRPRR